MSLWHVMKVGQFRLTRLCCGYQHCVQKASKEAPTSTTSCLCEGGEPAPRALCSVWKEFCLQEPPKDNSSHCALCGEGFVSWNHLKRHIKDSYWILFTFSHNLKRHMKSHPGENLYKFFRVTSILSPHKETHVASCLGQYHYALCGEQIYLQEHLKRHRLNHAG